MTVINAEPATSKDSGLSVLKLFGLTIGFAVMLLFALSIFNPANEEAFRQGTSRLLAGLDTLSLTNTCVVGNGASVPCATVSNYSVKRISDSVWTISETSGQQRDMMSVVNGGVFLNHTQSTRGENNSVYWKVVEAIAPK